MHRDLRLAIASGSILALSIRQPWADWILHRGKDVENRKWAHRYRGWALLHASIAPDPEFADIAAPMHRGGVVGAMRVVDCVSESASPWFSGPKAFVIGHRTALPFVPAKGRLGFYAPEPEVLQALLASPGLDA